MDNGNYLSIIIPTLNEEQNIGKVIDTIFKINNEWNILVVDDGSTDKTVEVVNKLKTVYRNLNLLDRQNEKIKGLTASVIAGINEINTDYFIVLDGDLQHPPEKLKELLNALVEGYDIAVGYREKVCVTWPIHRKIITKFGLFLGIFRLLLTGKICRDILSGFFGMRKDFFIKNYEKNPGRFNLEGYKILFDFLKNVDRHSKIKDIPFYFDSRKLGKSKLNLKHMKIYFKSLFK